MGFNKYMVKKLLEKSDSNRFSCDCCSRKIIKGEPMFRETKQGYRQSFKVNICRNCIIQMAVEARATQEEFDNAIKLVVANSLEKDEDEDEEYDEDN